jgi:hypothetical protein
MAIGAQPGVDGAGADAQGELDAQEAAEIAEKVCPIVRERSIVARNLTHFPRDVLVRGGRPATVAPSYPRTRRRGACHSG